MRREVGHCVRSSATPSVDRLQRITHRSDRIRRADQRSQQLGLHHRGVLVLVEEHHLDLAVEDLLNVLTRGKLMPEAQHIREIHHSLLGLLGAKLLDHIAQLEPACTYVAQFAVIGNRLRQTVDPLENRVLVCTQLRGSANVFRQLLIEFDDCLGEGGRGNTHVRQWERGIQQDSVRDLQRFRLREQPCPGFDADSQPVFGDELMRERVVRANGRGAGVNICERTRRVVLEQNVEQVPHARAELTCGLAGESQPDNLLGSDLARSHRPQHPRSHHCGLT